MTTKTITPTTSINPSQLKDDVEAILTANGFTLKDVERFEKQVAYRREYSQREDVKEARRLYNAQRNAKMKILRHLLKGGE